MLTAPDLQADPRAHLRERADLVDDAYAQVSAGLAANASVSIKGGMLRLSRLKATPLPSFDRMRHIIGSHLRRDDLDITLASLTVARSCDVGLVPWSRPGAGAGRAPSPM
ncbi:hypothetical protein ACIBKY_52900 [Nonomuraea sp. NPDC050394]|uniref:hypothetical protein n=1 Tax=Nonomuraea sp. NPDC050394 TaxID=3364363 RepID=UPI0037B25FC1